MQDGKPLKENLVESLQAILPLWMVVCGRLISKWIGR